MLFFGNTRLGGKGHLAKGMVDVTLLLGKTRNVGEKDLYDKRYDSYDSVREWKLFGRLNPSVGQRLLTRCMTKAYSMEEKAQMLLVKSHKALPPPQLKNVPL